MGLSWRRKFPNVPRIAYNDITTCPICNQDKPEEMWGVREIFHLIRHLKRLARGEEDT
jgi:hypothetical protein